MIHRLRAVFLALFVFISGSAELRADLEVNVRPDKIVLTDGSELACIVLMVTPQGALIVESDPDDPAKTRQRVVATAKIARVMLGEPNGTVAGLQTNTELARKVIQGSGFRKEEKPEKAEKGEKGKGKTGTRPAAKPKAETAEAPAPEDEPEETPPSKPARPAPEAAQPEAAPLAPAPIAPAGDERAPEAPVAAAPSRFSGQDLAAAYAARFPGLQFYAEQLVGLERAAQMFEQAKQDLPAREQLEGLLKQLVAEDTSILGERKVFTPQTPKRPQKVRRTPRTPPPAKEPPKP